MVKTLRDAPDSEGQDEDALDDGGALGRLVTGPSSQVASAPAPASHVTGNILRGSSFHSQYAEVLLLLDNISATKGKELPQELDDKVFKPQEGEPAKDWIQQIAEISDPPVGSEVSKSLQTARIYRARDALNSAAAPATGATIAFTLMVVGEQKARRMKIGPTVRPNSALSQLAIEAFPNLVQPAASFKRFLDRLFYGLIAWLVITSIASWYVATGNALLEQLAKAEAVQKVIYQNSESKEANAPEQQQRNNSPPTGEQNTPSPSVEASQPAADGTADNLRRPDELSRSEVDRRIALSNLRDWLQRSCPITMDCMDVTVGDDRKTTEPNWQWAGVLLAILANSILPVCYGLLGAAAAVARRLSSLMRDYMLTPRDHKLSAIQLTLGAVMGATIGLFVTPGGADQSSSQALLANIHLPTSAVCFVAGFGVEGVFQALESLVNRLFNLNSSNQHSNNSTT